MPKENQIVKRINNILKKDRRPILSVRFDDYDIKKHKKIINHYCGVFSSINDDSGGILWLKSEGSGTRDKKHSARMPVEIMLKSVISIKHLNVQDLIDNTNRLARIINEMSREALL